jgi:hypothetical protein
MEIKEARMTGLFSCRIEFGEFFGAAKSDLWVVMREATAQELASFASTFSNKDSLKASEEFTSLLPKLIIDSAFTDNGEKASMQEVAALIQSKGTLFSYVLKEWQESLPLAKGKSTKSER